MRAVHVRNISPTPFLPHCGHIRALTEKSAGQWGWRGQIAHSSLSSVCLVQRRHRAWRCNAHPQKTYSIYTKYFIAPFNFSIMETTKKLFNDWAARVSSFLQPFGKPVRVFTSSVKLDYRPKVVFVGYNSHPDRAYPADMDINECLHSSPFTLYLKRYEKAQKDNIPLPKPVKDDARSLITEAFRIADYHIPCYQENHVMMNAVYFCTDNIRQMRDSDPDGERKIKPCVDFTAEAITNIFRPRCVVTFSIQCFVKHLLISKNRSLFSSIAGGSCIGKI